MTSLRRDILTRSLSIAAAAAMLTAALSSGQDPAPAPAKRWFKGNLHTHTLNSDGDSSPADVAAWYRQNGYQFLVISDHNVFTATAELNATLGSDGKFLLIPGEEVSDTAGKLPVHLNAYNPRELIAPAHGETLVSVVQNNVNAILKAGGLPSLNHPNFGWAVRSQDALSIEGLALVEVYNGHPAVHNRGGGGYESLDEFWDALLTGGKRLGGVAVDDAHYFKKLGKALANPGRGWVQVRATGLSTAEVLRALETRDFYASTGVVLGDLEAAGPEYRLQIEPYQNFKYTTHFIGAEGKVLAKVYGLTPSYRMQPGDRYVRARVEASNGDNAWTQPWFAEAAR